MDISEVKKQTRSMILLCLRENYIEEAIEIEKEFQLTYPNNGYVYFENIKFVEEYYGSDEGNPTSYPVFPRNSMGPKEDIQD